LSLVFDPAIPDAVRLNSFHGALIMASALLSSARQGAYLAIGLYVAVMLAATLATQLVVG